jgi:hypothetical protein
MRIDPGPAAIASKAQPYCAVCCTVLSAERMNSARHHTPNAVHAVVATIMLCSCTCAQQPQQHRAYDKIAKCLLTLWNDCCC